MKKMYVVILVIIILLLNPGCGWGKSMVCTVKSKNYTETTIIFYNRNNEITKIETTQEYPFELISDEEWETAKETIPNVRGVKFSMGSRGTETRYVKAEVDYEKLDEDMSLISIFS